LIITILQDNDIERNIIEEIELITIININCKIRIRLEIRVENRLRAEEEKNEVDIEELI
jgi:hypothetical protein